MKKKSVFALGAASVALMATPAFAQAPDADEQGLGEIIVTAEKRETNLQRTPIAISVATGDDLIQRRVQSLADLSTGIPSLRIAPFFSRSSALTVGIRGIVPFDANQPSRDAGVGVYIDGVYLGRSQGLGAALFDIERIEVLKGPQGTLFGRNSTGGAVSIITKAPTGEFGMRTTIGVRNFGGYSAETHIDLPESNNISVKIDGIVTRRDGTVDNTLSGESDFNAYDRRGLHVGVLWKPSDSFTARYDFDISYDATTPYYVQLVERNPAAPAANFAPLVQVQSRRVSATDIGVPQEDSIGKNAGLALHLDWKASDALSLRSISSFRYVNQTQLDNGIGAHSGPFRPNANFARYSLASLRQEQYSQEVQLLGSFDNFDFVTGLYYYHENGNDDAWTPNTLRWNATGTVAERLPSLAAGATIPFPDRASTAKADSFAVFGQATWTPPILDGALKITAGARYTRDKKSGVLTKVNGLTPVVAGFTGAPTFNTSSSRVDPMVTLAIDPTGDIHLYAKYGTAYRAGGANSRSLTYRAFGPEEVKTFEIGFKGQFFDRKLRTNFAAYKTDYTDIQIDFSATNLLNSNRGTLETVNAPGKGTIEGIEADVAIAPLDGLTLTVAYAYTKIKLPATINPFTVVVPPAVPVAAPVFGVYTPENAISGSFDYRIPLGGATLRAHMDANYADGFNWSSSDATLTDKSFIVNGRLALGDIDLARGASLEVALWSRNLFNEQHRFVISRGAFAVFGTFGIFNEPRIFGADLTVKF